MGVPFSLLTYGVNLKRIWTSSSDDATAGDEDEEVRAPVRKRLKTAEYIYEHLFVGGEGSDVVIKTLDCEWKLHRVYLAQSSYFASMFSGKWRESNCDNVCVEFPDHRITADTILVPPFLPPALFTSTFMKDFDVSFAFSCFTTVLGSLYKDTIDVDVAKVVSLVATASALQLENVVQQCVEVMIGNISIKTVHLYYRASRDYGLKDVESHCRSWLEQNLLFYSSDRHFLRKITPSLMADLVKSPELHVVQGEMDLYGLLKKWMYLRCCDTGAVDADNEVKKAADEYFSTHCGGNSSFLESKMGRPFVAVFSKLRLQHMLTSMKSVETLTADNIVFKDVMETAMAAQWRQQLAINAEIDSGSLSSYDSKENNVTPEEEGFHNCAVRCGRVLQNDNTSCWRWTGYFFGIDVLLTYKNRVLSIKRNCTSQPPPSPVLLKAENKLYYRLSVIRFNEKRQKTWSFDTGLKCTTLKVEESIVAARVPVAIQFPLTVIFNFVTVPTVDDFIHSSLSTAWKKYTVDSSCYDEEQDEEDEEYSPDSESDILKS